MLRYVIGFGEQNVYFNGMAVIGFFLTIFNENPNKKQKQTKQKWKCHRGIISNTNHTKILCIMIVSPRRYDQ